MESISGSSNFFGSSVDIATLLEVVADAVGYDSDDEMILMVSWR